MDISSLLLLYYFAFIETCRYFKVTSPAVFPQVKISTDSAGPQIKPVGV